jgi:hypothetical protein
MVEALVVLTVLAHPAAALVTVLAPPLLVRRAWRPAVVLLYVAALALLALWLVEGYRAGVRADETATGGSILSSSGWFVLSLVAATASVVVARGRSAGHRSGTRAQSGA